MARESAPQTFWALVQRQHGVVTRRQLQALGFSEGAIDHRIARRRLHPLHEGVYAVGRPEAGVLGEWMAAVLACGPGALLSHDSAAAHWGIRPSAGRVPHVSVPRSRAPRRPGIRIHRRRALVPDDLAVHDGIPITSPSATIIDIAPGLSRAQLERAVSEADRLDLVTPEALRAATEGRRIPGARAIRELLDDEMFALTDSELERRFLLIVRRAGLPMPLTQARLNGFKVDFWWPDRGLIVETDGLRYHRTPTQQKRDRIRDQRHTAAGLTTLRFTYGQIVQDPRYVERTLVATWA